MTPTEHLPYVPLTMVRDHMDRIPSFACPTGYNIRTFRRGDEPTWARIEAAAGEFTSYDEALRDFMDEFGAVLDQMEDRCFLLEAPDGEAIGTATAWFGELDGETRGRVHWVGIVPEYQGRKLALPLLGAVMSRLARDHQKAYLTTQTTTFRAVNMYLNFGFVPYLAADEDDQGWRIMERVLARKILP